jgi:hypothetical protein
MATTTTTKTPADAATRRLAMVVRELLARETFTTEGDLREALKARATRYRLPWTRATLDAAVALVASNRRVLVEAPRPVPAPRVGPPPLSKTDARALVERLKHELGLVLRVMR